MGFGKGDDYIDYTLLKKKGILKIGEPKKIPIKSEGGFVDFTAFGTPNDSANTNTSPQSPSPAPNFDFLSDMASAGAANSSPPVNPLAGFDTFAPATSASGLSGNLDAKELNALKIKMDDIEYKVDRFIEKIDKLEEKLARFG